MMRKTFYSKIILFGEYSMIFDATALMIPFRKYQGEWRMDPALTSPGAAYSNKSVRKFCQYLQSDAELSSFFDFNRFQADLEAGLYFDANVPTGYGLGSSGTLTAAVFSRYATVTVEEALELKRILGRMESCFLPKR